MLPPVRTTSVLPPLYDQKATPTTGGVAGSSRLFATQTLSPDRLGPCAVQGCVQTYKKASVNVLRVRCHVQGLLGQGVAPGWSRTVSD
jgi:hypothetical protein